MIRLVALLGCMATSSIAHNFTAVPGYLPAYSPNASPQQNVTLASAELICGAVDACIGFSFRSPTAKPSGVVKVSFKALYDHCPAPHVTPGASRFRDGICPSYDGTDSHVRIMYIYPSHTCVLPNTKRLSCLYLSDTVIRPDPPPTERTD